MNERALFMRVLGGAFVLWFSSMLAFELSAETVNLTMVALDGMFLGISFFVTFLRWNG